MNIPRCAIQFGAGVSSFSPLCMNCGPKRAQCRGIQICIVLFVRLSELLHQGCRLQLLILCCSADWPLSPSLLWSGICVSAASWKDIGWFFIRTNQKANNKNNAIDKRSHGMSPDTFVLADSVMQVSSAARW